MHRNMGEPISLWGHLLRRCHGFEVGVGMSSTVMQWLCTALCAPLLALRTKIYQ